MPHSSALVLYKSQNSPLVRTHIPSARDSPNSPRATSLRGNPNTWSPLSPGATPTYLGPSLARGNLLRMAYSYHKGHDCFLIEPSPKAKSSKGFLYVTLNTVSRRHIYTYTRLCAILRYTRYTGQQRLRIPID